MLVTVWLLLRLSGTPVEVVSSGFHRKGSWISGRERRLLFANIVDEYWLIRILLQPVKRSASLLFFFLSSVLVSGQSLSSALQSIYNFDFQRAEQQLNELRHDPGYPSSQSLCDFLRLLSIQTDPAYKDYLALSDELDVDARHLIGSNEFALAEFSFRHYLYQSVAAGHFGDLKKSGAFLLKAYRAHKELNRLRSAHPSARFSTAFFNLLSEQVPDRYRGLLTVAGMEMTKGEGLQGFSRLFRQYAGKGNAVEAETSLFWILLLWSFDEDADKLASEWEYLQANSSLSAYLVTRYLGTMVGFKTGNARLLQTLFAELQPQDYQRLPYLYYQRGKFELLNLQAAGVSDMQRFLNTHREANFARSAAQKLAWYYDVEEQGGEAEKWYTYLLNHGLTHTWADEEAIHETRENRPYNRDLLKLRMLFDGGRYHETIAAVKTMEVTHQASGSEFKAELLYRTARSYQELGETDQAAENYQKLLSGYPDIRSYIVPKSALLLATLKYEAGDHEEALRWLSFADSHNKYGFRSTFERQIDSLRRLIDSGK